MLYRVRPITDKLIGAGGMGAQTVRAFVKAGSVSLFGNTWFL
jgi:hypothetical protein